jgi:hypothetical protein
MKAILKLSERLLQMRFPGCRRGAVPGGRLGDRKTLVSGSAGGSGMAPRPPLSGRKLLLTDFAPNLRLEREYGRFMRSLET